MSALAIDIGTYSIKAVSAKPGSHVEVQKAVEVFNTTGLSIPTDDAQIEKLGKLLETVFADNNLPRTDVRLSLPEAVVSTKIINLPWLSDAELASAIGWQAEQHIPIPPEELSLEYQVLYRPPANDKGSQMRVLLIGVRKSVIDRYVALFNALGIEPGLVETQTLSVIRSLQFQPTDPTTLLVHLGAASMNLAVMYQGELMFVYTHLNGGQLLTRALEQGVGLDATQAEQYKRTYGLDQTQFQGKVRDALLPAVKLLVTELQKAVRFFTTQHATEQIQRVLLSGGSAQLPGLVEHITSELGAEVLVAAPFAEAKGDIPQVNQAAFTVCMGLLMRQV